jgi:hypothetical protein
VFCSKQTSHLNHFRSNKSQTPNWITKYRVWQQEGALPRSTLSPPPIAIARQRVCWGVCVFLCVELDYQCHLLTIIMAYQRQPPDDRRRMPTWLL